MRLYIEIKNRIVHKIKRAEEKTKADTKGVVVSIEDEDDMKNWDDIFCVIDVSRQGQEIQAYCFKTLDEAKDTFQTQASNKFSNWEEYSSEDVEAILDQGFEKTGDGSLCLCSL